MDKYEYKLKTEQMLKLMENGAYNRAAEIADSIDWKRVRNVNMLLNVSNIYEKIRDYRKSFGVLRAAYHRTEGSRKILYRLCTLAIKVGNLEEAIDYYDEYVQAAPKDPNQYILRYRLLRARRAPIEQQIRALEAQLKVQLFQHAQRRVVLTPAGWEFYPKAKQLLELYDDAVNCAQAAERNANPPKRHLLIGHQNMPLQMLGFDLFAATEELSTRFSPLMYSCANRKDIGRALLNGEIDLSLQIECAEIAAGGLHFYPAVYMPEIGIPFHTPPEVPRGHIPLEQAVKYRWMFAGTPEQSLYETALLHEASRRRAEIIRGVKSVQYKLPSLMLTPAVYYRRPNLEQVFVLDWNKGMRFGIVTKAEPDPVVEEYVRQLQHLLPLLSEKLFGMKLEPVED